MDMTIPKQPPNFNSPISKDGQKCRICRTPSPLFFDNGRQFFKCPECSLIFTPDGLDRGAEEKHYRDQWGTGDPAGWEDKARLIRQIAELYRRPRRVLDFGSGSGDLARALRRLGFSVTELEPMVHGYLKDQNYSERFDVVVGVEVIEHLPDPWAELREIEKVLAEGGIMIFSTLFTNSFVDRPGEVEQFREWWYKNDPTHLNFFCNRVFTKMADLGGYDIDVFGNWLFVIQKQAAR